MTPIMLIGAASGALLLRRKRFRTGSFQPARARGSFGSSGRRLRTGASSRRGRDRAMGSMLTGDASYTPDMPDPAGPRIIITRDCYWDIPYAWWLKVAQPKLESWVMFHGLTDPEQLAQMILANQTGKCRFPNSTAAQVDNPQGVGYWPGPPTMLYLLQHVKQEIVHALGAWDAAGRTGKPVFAILLPQKG